MSRRTRWILISLLAVVLAPVVGTFLYFNVIRDDPPEELTLDDAPTTTGEPSGTTEPAGSDGLAGEWQVADGSVVGYRVQETLFGQSADGVGRSEGVSGTLSIAGTTVTEASFEVDMTTFVSDESRRDGQFEGRIMETAQFPTAQFVLTAPIELGAVPADGEGVTAEATGELTLHGVTRAITIPLTAKLTGDTFAVNGSVTITFADYEINDPSGGPASVGDDGELEVLLVFAR
jgi:polyisoprenoid-binding protein YceI